MVDSRKSLHAKQQRRRANGEFAEEQDTGLPSGDTLTDFEWKRLNNAMLAAETNIIMDPDVADCAGYATRRLDELIARPAKPGETDDMPLISDILPRLMRGGGFLLKNPNGFSIDRLSPHALWFARCFTSRAVRRFFWLRPGCSGRRSRPGHAEPRTAGTSIP